MHCAEAQAAHDYAIAQGHVLRDYQSTALDSLRTALARLLGEKKRAAALLVAPTGSGKTTVAAAMIRGAVAKGLGTLFLAHRRELIDQCSERLDGAGVDHGVIQATHPRELPGLSVQVASVQTLVKRELQKPPSLIIIDEAHRARAKTYGKILDRFPDAVIVGLTATPIRTDGRGLGELFNDMVEAETPAGLIRRGFLVPYDGFAYESASLNKELERVQKRGADYDAGELGAVMGAGKLVGNVVEQWCEHAENRRTVVFAVNIEHSLRLVERFRAAGVLAEHVDGETPVRERAAILKRLRLGDTRVVCNVGIITEGFDLPALEVCVLARPTLSLAIFLQQVGRVLRTCCRSCGNGTDWQLERCQKCGSADVKRVARIHDHARCFMTHGAPDADRGWALNYDVERRKRLRAMPLRTCDYCLRVFDPSITSACPSCGRANESARREVVEITKNVRAIPLSDLPRFKSATPEEKAAHWKKLCSDGAAAGRKRGWAAHKFRAIYGEWPPRGG